MKIFLNLIFILLLICSFSFSQTLNLENFRYINGDNEVKFLKQINELGRVGYKLKTIVYVSEKYSKNIRYTGLMEFVGIDESFEYKSFYSNRISNLASSLSSYQNDGFSVVDSLPLLENGDAPVCPEFDTICPSSVNDFDYQLISGNLIIFERKNVVSEIAKQEFVEIKEKSFISTVLKNNTKLDDFREKNYFPIRAFYTQNSGVGEYLFIMQKSLQIKPEFLIVSEIFGYNSKINFFTQKGYILASPLYLGDFTKIAVMNRKPLNTDFEISRIISPKDIKPDEFLKTKLKFKSVLWSFKGYKRGYEKEKLQFIEPTDTKTEYSYKIVKMKELKPGKPIDSIEASKEATSEYKALVAQGYVIKDLYVYNGINMLLEKVIK